MNELSSQAGAGATAGGAVTRERDFVRAVYPRVVGSAVRGLARARVALWDRSLENLQRVQEKTLLSLLEHARETEFGRKLGFSHIRSHADFVRCVPIGDYDAFSGYIDRMRAGERNVLLPEFVRYFGNSSGSSNEGRPKFLPISDRQVRFQQQAGADTVMRYLDWSGHGEIMAGFTLGLFPPTTMRRDGAVLVTSNPALMMTKMPLFTRPVYLPEEDVRTIANYEDKLRVIAERYVDYDVRAIAGTTCWFTLLFEKVLAAAHARGRRVRTICDVWPGLRVLFGGGVAAAPYLPVIRDFVGRDDVTLVDTYNATEGGVYAASDNAGARGMLMLPHRGTFFEFVPLEERGRASPERVPLWAVEKEVPYSVVVTTCSGLYAYELGDIVRFPSIGPPRVEFMGRLSGCLSLTQELMTHVEIERAVEHACLSCQCTTVDFGAAGEVAAEGTAKSRYLLFVEFAEGSAPRDLATFAAKFDESLCEQNRVYREHRAGDVALLAPCIVPLEKRGARLFLEEVTGGNVQGKFPRIIDETKKELLWKHAARVRELTSAPKPGKPAMNRIGVAIVGVNGAVASTVIAGVELMKRGFAPRIGMITERTDARIVESITELLDFVPLENIVFSGWDLQFANVYEGALHHKVLPAHVLENVRPELERMKPWPAVFAKSYVGGLNGDNVVRTKSFRDDIACLERDVENFRNAHGLDRVIMVNLASTERFLDEQPVHRDLHAFEAGVDASDPCITPAMRYFYAANRLRVPYCNFTPSLTNVPALAQQAMDMGNPYAGMDGKTGQTLVKTALASMFRARRLHIQGWYSANVLGNSDGLVLDDPSSNKTKVLSKAAVLDSIVGYHVENHQVHIHYYKPRGDSKEAWDNIDIVGFAGVPMQIKVNFLCQDSVLAAPLVIDLVRLLDVAKRVGERGIQRQLSMFFKSPYHAPGESPVHDLFKQEKLLLDWARAHANAKALVHTNGVKAHAEPPA